MIWSWLAGWWKRRRGPVVEVVCYTRRGCHLCDTAWDLLAEERDRGRYCFRLTAVDVDADPALAARYGDSVPVVAMDGVVRFRGHVNRVLLRRLLRHRIT